MKKKKTWGTGEYILYTPWIPPWDYMYKMSNGQNLQKDLEKRDNISVTI